MDSPSHLLSFSLSFFFLFSEDNLFATVHPFDWHPLTRLPASTQKPKYQNIKKKHIHLPLHPAPPFNFAVLPGLSIVLVLAEHSLPFLSFLHTYKTDTSLSPFFPSMSPFRPYTASVHTFLFPLQNSSLHFLILLISLPSFLIFPSHLSLSPILNFSANRTSCSLRISVTLHYY